MVKQTILDQKDIAAIAHNYQLHVDRWTPIEGGDENSSFLLTSFGAEYVLTVSEKKAPAEVEQAAQLLIHLARHGYFTNQVILTRDGRSVIDYQGKPVSLKTWIPGETLRDTKQGDYHSIGRAVAGLHQVPVPGFLRKEHRYGLKYMPDSLGHGVDDEFEVWLADMNSYLWAHFPAHLPQALIHSDLFDDNIIYHQGKFQALIDFNEACYYYKAYDLGSVLFGACMQNGELVFSQARDVIRGYEELLELEAGERAVLQYSAVYAGAAIAAWHYLHSTVLGFDGTRVDKYRLAAHRTEHIHQIPPADFNTILD